MDFTTHTYAFDELLVRRCAAVSHSAVHLPLPRKVHMVMELMTGGSVLSGFRGRPVTAPLNLLLAASAAAQVGRLRWSQEGRDSGRGQ